ncbi:hypothetical protein [Bacterioplanoides sp.]|uniref:hypothetical protein n=1 Tax=Bacterioplanoides sp. TaxID=2066072 RepID=UPI003B5A2247
MAILKKIIIVIVSLLLISAGALYLYIQSLPTGAPEYVNVEDLDDSGQLMAFSCSAGQSLNVAYRVTVTVASELNDRAVYDSRLRFNAHLQQANDNVVKGLADDIRVNEGEGDLPLHDVLFLTKANADQYLVFSSFNSLGLIERHPMAILSQLIKALSVGNDRDNYFFPYDAMQRTYRYRHDGGSVERAVFPTTANIDKFVNSFNEYKSDWQVTLDSHCLPKTLVSNEQQAITAAGHQGFIRFRIEAERIPAVKDLSQLDYSAYANSGNHWNVKQVNGDDVTAGIENEQQMWQAIAGFDSSKDVAALKQAANYMLDNFSADDTRDALLQGNLDDATKRDLIFALGLTGREDAEAFMLDTLAAMPLQAGTAADLQKVRLMVSLSSNDKVTQQSFDRFSALANQTDESANVRNNALINMGTTIKTLEAAGESTSGLQDRLKGQLSDTIEQGGNQSASAILAAGNANISGLENKMVDSLANGSSKERYASGAVLSRNPDYRQSLIEHIAKEPSNLVNNAILSNWDASALTPSQRQQLTEIAAQSDAQKAELIGKFLK